MITNYPITNGIFKDIDRFVNHALGAVEPMACQESGCDLEKKRDVENGSETSLGWRLRFELPGFKKDEVEINIEEDFLNVIAATEDEERNFLGKVKRRVRISDEVDIENISARLEDGILYLEILRKAKAEPRRIVIS